jgi:hypothetical protein
MEYSLLAECTAQRHSRYVEKAHPLGEGICPAFSPCQIGKRFNKACYWWPDRA